MKITYQIGHTYTYYNGSYNGDPGVEWFEPIVCNDISEIPLNEIVRIVSIEKDVNVI